MKEGEKDYGQMRTRKNKEVLTFIAILGNLPTFLGIPRKQLEN